MKKEKKNNPEKLLSSPGKRRPRPNIIQKIDDFDFGIIRRTINKFYIELKQVCIFN